MKSNMRKRPAAEEFVDHDDDDEDASNIAFPHFPSPEHNIKQEDKEILTLGKQLSHGNVEYVDAVEGNDDVADLAGDDDDDDHKKIF